ncbi:MAG: NPXTG-anchored protein [Ruminococcus sp.]|nr:NPXTG-anchored protein [Ruminococcus sp.]
MKISKIFAGMSAMALAASMLTVAASADDAAALKAELGTGVANMNALSLLDELDKDTGEVVNTGLLTGTGVAVTDIYGIKINVTVGETTAAGIADGSWIGGGMGYNSDSTSWASTEWSFQDGAKPVTGTVTDDGSYDFVLLGDAPVFTDSETYAQVWMQNWSTSDFTYNYVELLDADGNALVTVENGADDPVVTPYANVYAADIEGKGNFRIELFNIYGDTNNNEDFKAAYETLSAAKEIEVQFTIQGIPESEEGFTAFLMYTDKNWAWGNWDPGTTPGAVDAVVNADGTYSVKINNEIAGATAEDGGAMIATGANVFCVDIIGLADAAGAGTAGTDLSTAADKQALAVEKGLIVTDVKVFTDGVEFVPGVGYKDEPIDDSSEAEESSSEAETSCSEAEVSSSESTADSTSSKASSSSSKATNNNTTTNPNTGAAALAAVGVALAGAAVVASKKRK